MSEYKDVELLKKQIADFKRAVNSVKPMNSDYLTGYISALSAVEEAIAKQPTADVAEVVRCKDCKWYKESKLLATNKFCFRLKDRNGDRVGYNFAPDDFCSYGERMDGDPDANGNDNKTPET